jgi:hypothetical protein
MSRAAAAAMRDLADCLDEEAEGDNFPVGTGYQIMKGLARAHRAAADRIEARAAKSEPVPAKFKSGQAGTRRSER